jgi:membrane-bound serine protease (ClpP class)
MQEDAALGDIGRGRPLAADQRESVIGLVKKRHNRLVNTALATAMLDKDQRIIKVEITSDAGAKETRILTVADWQRLADSGANIRSETIKEQGVVGVFSASEASQLGILAVQVRQTRGEVAELYGLPRLALRSEPAQNVDQNVRMIKVTGMIDPLLEAFLERQIRRAVAEGANLIIFEIDSFGGRLVESEQLAFAIAELDSEKVRTVAYVPDKAISGAAIIALGCDEIYMHPNAQIGDAEPIELGEGQVFNRVPEKLLSKLRVTMATLARLKGRSPGLLQAMCDKDLAVFAATDPETGRVTYMTEAEIEASEIAWIQGKIVRESRSDNVLTVDGLRASELGLTQPPVHDLEQLKERLGIPAKQTLRAVEATWVDDLIFVLNTRAAMFFLIMFGVILIYLELHFPSGLMGILSVLCFALFFWSRYLGGTAGWLEVVLFVIGLACIGLEVFVVPGFGVFGISGGLLVLSSLVMAGTSFASHRMGTESGIQELGRSVGTLGASLVSVVVITAVLNRYLPSIPFFNKLILSPPGMLEPGEVAEPQLKPELESVATTASILDQDPELLGRQGTSQSMLRPSGKALIEGRFLDVVSEGPFIDRGVSIEVVEVLGNRIVVRSTS